MRCMPLALAGILARRRSLPVRPERPFVAGELEYSGDCGALPEVEHAQHPTVDATVRPLLSGPDALGALIHRPPAFIRKYQLIGDIPSLDLAGQRGSASTSDLYSSTNHTWPPVGVPAPDRSVGGVEDSVASRVSLRHWALDCLAPLHRADRKPDVPDRYVVKVLWGLTPGGEREARSNIGPGLPGRQVPWPAYDSGTA